MGGANKNMMNWKETNHASAVIERMDVDDDNGEDGLVSATISMISHTSWAAFHCVQ